MWGSQFFYGSVKVSADLLSVLYIPVPDQSGDYRINSKLFPNCRKIRPFCGNNPSFHVVSSSMLCRFLPSKRHNNNIVTHNPVWLQVFCDAQKMPQKNVPTGNYLSRYGTFLLSDSFIQISPHYSAVLLLPALQGGLQFFYGFSSLAAALPAVRMAVLPFSQISQGKS